MEPHGVRDIVNPAGDAIVLTAAGDEMVSMAGDECRWANPQPELQMATKQINIP